MYLALSVVGQGKVSDIRDLPLLLKSCIRFPAWAHVKNNLQLIHSSRQCAWQSSHADVGYVGLKATDKKTVAAKHDTAHFV